MDDKPLFQGMDEFERTYAPQQLSPDDPERERVLADEGGVDDPTLTEPASPAPVASMGNAPSAIAAPPNQGHEDHGGASGDPKTEARYPMDDSDEQRGG
jgi:hypothetical protein